MNKESNIDSNLKDISVKNINYTDSDLKTLDGLADVIEKFTKELLEYNVERGKELREKDVGWYNIKLHESVPIINLLKLQLTIIQLKQKQSSGERKSSEVVIDMEQFSEDDYIYPPKE